MIKVTELHPEELLDREMRGSLSDLERTRLEAHLAQCAVCRLERSARGDFADDLDADVVVPRIAERVLAPLHAQSSDATRHRRIRWVALLAAAALTVTTAAIAARVTLFAATRSTSENFGFAPHVERKSLDSPVATHHAVYTVAPRVETSAVASATPPMTNRPELTAIPEVPETTSATMFARANEARGSGDHARAAALYRDVVNGHATSHEAAPARLALARMLLDDGDAAGALTNFDAYLQDAGVPLREEALFGRAQSLEVLHRADEERAAWSALLNAYPQTVHAARAQKRLEELASH